MKALRFIFSLVLFLFLSASGWARPVTEPTAFPFQTPKKPSRSPFNFQTSYSFSLRGLLTGPSKRFPDVALNPVQERLFVVWQESTFDEGTKIMGELRGTNGTPLGEPFLISRTAPNCLPDNFFERIQHPRYDYSNLPLPTHCLENSHPVVAYNETADVYLVAWQVTIDADDSYSTPFKVILAQAYRDSGEGVEPVWTTDEGISDPIVISRYFVAVHVAEGTGTHRVRSGEVLAFSSARHPDIVAAPHGDFFLVSYVTDNPISGISYPTCPVEGATRREWQASYDVCFSRLQDQMAYDYGVQVRPFQVKGKESLYPLSPPYLYYDTGRDYAHLHPLLAARVNRDLAATDQFVLVFEQINPDAVLDRGLQSVSFSVESDTLRFLGVDSLESPEPPHLSSLPISSDFYEPEDPTLWLEALQDGEFFKIQAVAGSFGEEPYQLVYRSVLSGETASSLTSIALDEQGQEVPSTSLVIPSEREGSMPVLQEGEARGEAVSLLGYALEGTIQGDLLTSEGVDFLSISALDDYSIHVDPSLVYIPSEESFYALWTRLTPEGVSEVTGAVIPLQEPIIERFGLLIGEDCQNRVGSTPPVPEIHPGEALTLCWETTGGNRVRIDYSFGGGWEPAISGEEWLPPSGERVPVPLTEAGTYTFRLEAYGALETVSQIFTIRVRDFDPPVISSFTVDGGSQTTISAGDSVLLVWRVTAEASDEVHVHIERIIDGHVVVSDSLDQEGSEIDAPTQTTSYALTVNSFGGERTGYVTVFVTP